MFKPTMKTLKILAVAAISLLAVVVVLQNTQTVETNLLFFTLSMPNAAFLFGTLIIGFAIGVLTAGHIVPTVSVFRNLGGWKKDDRALDGEDHAGNSDSPAAKPHVKETAGTGK